jgi:hypothetical protein
LKGEREKMKKKKSIDNKLNYYGKHAPHQQENDIMVLTTT